MENKNNLLVKMENAGVYLNNKWLVKDVTLNIEKGKIITLIGPNGSGKTTTAKIALGLYKNISGKVEKYTKKIAYVPQKISVDWTLPIRVFDFMNLTSDLQNNETNEALEITGAKHLINNDLKTDENLFIKKNKFKGKIGIFEINKKTITHQLNFYEILDKNFKEIF